MANEMIDDKPIRQEPFKLPIQDIIDDLVDTLQISDGHARRLSRAFKAFTREIKRASTEGEW